MVDLTGLNDERKLRRYAMDIIRASWEGVIDPELSLRLAVDWGLLERTKNTETGEPWLNFTQTLIGDELDREDDPANPAEGSEL